MGFMNLSLPTPTVTLGPAWATQLNAAINVIDAHDHSEGKGPRVKTAGISINADLTFSNFAATNLKSTTYTTQNSQLTSIQSLYAYGGDLWWTNSNGAPVQVTAGGGLAPVSASADTFSFILRPTSATSVTLTSASAVIQAFRTSVNAVTVTLPAASTVTAGRIFVIKDFSGTSETRAITVAANGTDGVDGNSSVVLESNYGALFLVSDGDANWFLV